MKIPFSIEYRPQIESGEYKVETRDGRPARIICWNKAGYYPIVFLEMEEPENEWPQVCGIDGRYYSCDSPIDLFIITPEPELTDWETFISGCLQKHGLLDCGAADRIAQNCSAELLDLAREELEPEVLERLEIAYKNQDEVVYENGKRDGKAEALKDLPRWIDDGLPKGSGAIDISGLCGFDFIRRNGKLLRISDIEKLPGFNE